MAQHTQHIGFDLEPEEAIAQIKKRRKMMLASVVAIMVVALAIAFLAVYAAYTSGPYYG